MWLKEGIDDSAIYQRKPLNVNVPDLGSAHSKKNPFTKCVHGNTFTSTKPAILYDSKIENALNKRSNTITIEKVGFPRPTPVRIPMPGAFDAEGQDEACARMSEEAEKSVAQGNEEERKTGMSDEVEHYFKVLQRLALPSEQEAKLYKVALPLQSRARSSDKTLVLDLDETLIHTISSSFDYSDFNAFHEKLHTTFYKNNETKCISTIKFIIRPHAINFLKELSSIYEIIVVSY